jgi:membrane fusion protein (multidrug efflux system)
MPISTEEERQKAHPEEPAKEEERVRREEKPMAPRRELRPLILGALAVAAIVGGAFYLHTRNRESTDDAQVDGDIVPISSKISGSVVEVLVNDNQEVKAGQVLVRIDPRDYQARVDQLRAALAMAESQARGAQAGVPVTAQTTVASASGAAAQVASAEAELARARTTAQKAATADLAYAQANVQSAQANYDRAQADLARMKPLAEKAEISQQQFDSYVAAARVAESQLRAAQQRLAAAQDEAQGSQSAVLAAQARVDQAHAALAQSLAEHGQVAVSTAQASSASAAVKQAQANLAAAELQLSYTTIAAPVDGVVTKKTVQVGQIVQPGQALMTVVPLHRVWVTANFKETQLKNVRPGQRAEAKVDMYGRSFPGSVDSIAGATGTRLSLLPPENASGNYVKVVQRIPVKITLAPLPAGYVLRPGMNVSAIIFTN